MPVLLLGLFSRRGQGAVAALPQPVVCYPSCVVLLRSLLRYRRARGLGGGLLRRGRRLCCRQRSGNRITKEGAQFLEHLPFLDLPPVAEQLIVLLNALRLGLPTESQQAQTGVEVDQMHANKR